jgi:hypothetical protein
LDITPSEENQKELAKNPSNEQEAVLKKMEKEWKSRD